MKGSTLCVRRWWALHGVGRILLFGILLIGALAPGGSDLATSLEAMRAGFVAPPRSARPWVYWFWMDGNVSRDGITADLEAMNDAGLGGVILMEVDVGVPRGPVAFMGSEWRGMFRHAVREAERLGLEITLNAGPGWTGSGGPWVKPEASMQHLVASAVEVRGPMRYDATLPRPKRRPAFFGDGALPPALEAAKNEFYRDEMVLAFPTPEGNERLQDLDEKALYVRAPYSSQPGVRASFPSSAVYRELPESAVVDSDRVVDLTGNLGEDGRLAWDVPEGPWTIARLGRTSTGANTRPAPFPGLGLESDKLDAAALDAHFDAFVGTLLREVEPRADVRDRGWTTLHIDSWEMGAQNWTPGFRREFEERRGYDLKRYLPVLTGRVVDGLGISERFLWDLRQTVQELILERHAGHLRELAHRHGFRLSIEPYDMTPCADLSLGTVADTPMGEFWMYGFKTSHTVYEAVSVAHTCGRTVVGAEAFTSSDAERWQAHPGSMKGLGDWAFCAGINRIVFHRYQHQPWLDRWPGMTMGPYGVHWERTQTWWDMVPAYHEYLARCQYLLRLGVPVVDVCALAAEGAPHVFHPPAGAMRGDPPEMGGYRVDGCAPETLLNDMSVQQGRLSLPGGMGYQVLVLPERETMTPPLLRKVRNLVGLGATVFGSPPKASPSLSGFPGCDEEVRRLSRELWGDKAPSNAQVRVVGKGRMVKSRPSEGGSDSDYGDFAQVTEWLRTHGIPPDFEGDSRLRHLHRRAGDLDIYFVASRETTWLQADCAFRVTGKVPEFWDPRTGSIRGAVVSREEGGRTWVPLNLEPEGSVFVVFRPGAATDASWNRVQWNGVSLLPSPGGVTLEEPVATWFRDEHGNLRVETPTEGRHAIVGPGESLYEVEVRALPQPRVLTGPWEVRFQPGRGAPERRVFESLTDWSLHDEAGVRFFSGVARYSTVFELGQEFLGPGRTVEVDLGHVEVMARVLVNDQEAGVCWKEPFRMDVSKWVRAGTNRIEIQVANRWPNRLIGDQALPEADRVTWTTWNPFKADSSLLPSGLMGPVRVRSRAEVKVESAIP